MACKTPIKPPQQDIYVSCGRCIECLIQKQQSWILRMRLELKNSMRASFLTLTYETVPENDGYPDVSAFLKRYRASIQTKPPSTSIRFLNITEYGSRYGRLHHHMAMFHLPKSLKVQTLFELWQHGRVSISPLTPKRVNYIAEIGRAHV